MSKRPKRGREIRRAQKRKRREKKREEKLRMRRRAMRERANHSFLESELERYRARPLPEASHRANHIIFALVSFSLLGSLWFGGIITGALFAPLAGASLLAISASFLRAEQKHKRLVSKRGANRRLSKKAVPARKALPEPAASEMHPSESGEPEEAPTLVSVARPQKDALSAPSGQPFVVSSFED